MISGCMKIGDALNDDEVINGWMNRIWFCKVDLECAGSLTRSGLRRHAVARWLEIVSQPHSVKG
jgi:hypothetical protein